MKKMTLILALSLASAASSAQAALHPWLRTCIQAGGEMWIGNVHPTVQPALCLLGSAAIGAEALFIYKTDGGTPDVIAQYLAGERQCHGQASVSYGTDGRQFTLCTFADGSTVEMTTLNRGAGSSANAALDAALRK